MARIRKAGTGRGMLGERLGPYEVLAKLGQGGMGEVFQARDTRLNRLVALKILPREKFNEDRRRRFLQEAQAASALNHPNIITIYDAGSEPVAPGSAAHEPVDYIAMELVRGATLDARIPARGLPLNEALRIALEIADGLGCAHDAGIIHRDLKPSNVMLTPEGRVKLLDFGLAKLVEPPSNPSDSGANDTTDTLGLTEEGEILGTSSYMSPEQAEARRIDPRSDIFSFGCLLYEMLTGVNPFRKESRLLTLSAIVRDEAPPLPAPIPAELDRIVQRCLKKDPARRFQTIQDARVALLEVKEESDSGSRPRPRVHSGLPLRPFLGGAVAAALFVAGVIAIMNRGQRDQGSAPELKLTPLTSYPGVEDSPSFSPDGSQVAFAWNDPAAGNFDLYVKLAGAGNPVRLTQSELDDRGPAWSPDGKWIAFTRPVLGQAERSRLVLIPALGGAERDLGEIRSSAGQALAWLKSSRSLVIADRAVGQNEAFALYRLDLDTGHRTRLTQPGQGITGDRNPAVSPDGKTLAYLRYLSGSVVAVMYRAELRADGTLGAAREIPLPGRGANALAFAPDGRALVFQRGRAGGLWRVPVDGGTPEPIPFASPAGQFPAVSPAAGRLAFSRSLDNANLYLVPRAKPALVPFETSPGADYSARFSPSGAAVVFATDRDGDEQLLIREGDNPPRPLVPPAYLMPGSARWSPDGQRILFDARKEGQSEIYETMPAGGEPRRLTQHPADDVVPFYSNDGASVYFASTRSGRMEIWRMPASGGEAQQITRNGAFFGFLSADGQSLYHTRSRADGQLSRLQLATGEERLLPVQVNNRGFEVQPDGIYFIDPARRLLWFPFPAGPAQTLLEIEGGTAMGLSYSKARDALVLGRFDARGADLFLVDNFR